MNNKLFMKIMLKIQVNKARIKRTNQYRYGKNRNIFRIQLFQEFDEITKSRKIINNVSF